MLHRYSENPLAFFSLKSSHSVGRGPWEGSAAGGEGISRAAAVLLQGFKAKSLNNTSDFHYPGRGSGPLSSLILRNTERGQAPRGVTWSFPSLGSKESELVENSAGFCKASATCGRARGWLGSWVGSYSSNRKDQRLYH